MMTVSECERTHPMCVSGSISWRSVGENVQVLVEVINLSSEETLPDTLVIEAAAFGAFVPTVPIARIAVDSLDPGERRKIMATIPRIALDAITQGTSSATAGGVDPGILTFFQAVSENRWIGNLNVYFETAPEDAVERHRAFGLKVPVSTELVARFVVSADTCTFVVRCSDEGWCAEMIASRKPRLALLRVRTASDPGKKASVTVDVTRTRDGKVVPVEFEFETVAGSGQTLGCIKL